MKLIIQIPCFNEAATLPATLADLPRRVEGIDLIETLVIDDGSTDNTATVAQEHGVDHVVRLGTHRGLAAAFATGLETALRLGADVIVNTDADNQYCGPDIAQLVRPILRSEAAVVIGERPIEQTSHFPWWKKRLQRLGSSLVRRASRTRVRDATSGFRAYSRDAALRLSVFSDYTYVLETIIQAGQKGLAIASVPVRTNPPTRPSRLIPSVSYYLGRSVSTIFRIFMMYRPLRVLGLLGSCLFLLGVFLAGRYMYFLIAGAGRGHIQSLVVAAALLMIGVQIIVIGLVGDLVGRNRRLMEEALYRLRRLELASRRESEHDPGRAPSEVNTHARSSGSGP